MKQALVSLPNERPECNDIKLGDCLRLLRTHRGRTIILVIYPYFYSLQSAVTSLVHPRVSILHPQAPSCKCGWESSSSVASADRLSQELRNLLVEFCIDVLMKNKMFTYVFK